MSVAHVTAEPEQVVFGIEPQEVVADLVRSKGRTLRITLGASIVCFSGWTRDLAARSQALHRFPTVVRFTPAPIPVKVNERTQRPA